MLREMLKHKVVKITLKILSILFVIIALIYTSLGIYVSSHHEEILQNINKVAYENFKGDIKIGDLDILFFKGFPNLTLKIKDIEVKDSLWNQHKKTLLKSEMIYAKILPWAILHSEINIKSITIEGTTLDIYVDENGYSNISAFEKRKNVIKDTTSKESILNLEINKILLKRVNFISENLANKKLFDFRIDYLDVKINPEDDKLELFLKLKTEVKSLAFNTVHGSFAKNKIIQGNLFAVYDKTKKSIAVNSESLEIGKTTFKLAANFGTSQTNSLFAINLFSKSILWKEASSLVSKNIAEKLNKFDFEKPFEVKCDILGDLKVKGDPAIHVVTNFKDNTLKALDYQVDKCNFKGEFTNDYAKNRFFDDANSAILLHDFQGDFKNIPFKTKNLMILDLKKPIASGYFVSNFDVIHLNSLLNKELFDFKKGNANVEVTFKSDVVNFSISKPFIIGDIKIEDTDFKYVPGNVDFNKNNINLEFTTDKLIVKNISCETEKSKIQMHGYSENFMNLFYDSPEKIVLNWDIYCQKLVLEDFMYLLHSKKNNTISKKPKNKEFIKNVIKHSNLVANVKIDKLNYKKFNGTDAKAKVSIVGGNLLFNEVSIKNNNGTYFVKGMVTPSEKNKKFNVQVLVKNSDIDKLLYSFDNFGMNKINYNTLRGDIDITTNLSGLIGNEGGLIENSLIGNLKFNLRNGALINFEPIENVGKFVFPNRNFKNIKIDKIDGDVDLKNGIVSIKPMQINTSVIKLDIAGDYGLNSGTNLQLDVHLRDPAKDAKEVSKAAKIENRNKGVIVHLQAVDDKNGKIKIKPRPFIQTTINSKNTKEKKLKILN